MGKYRGGLWIMIALCAIIGAAAALVGGYSTWFLFYGMTALTLYAAAVQLLCLTAVEAERSVNEERLFAGEEAIVTVTVRYRSRLPLLWLAVHDEWENAGRHRLGRYRKLLFPGSRKVIRFQYKITHVERGRHRFGALLLVTGDVFGIALKVKTAYSDGTFAGSGGFTVYPRPLDVLSRTPIAQSGAYGEAEVRLHHAAESPFDLEVREYAAGDPFKRIHWKATARAQQLMAKKPDTTLESSLLIILDASVGGSVESGHAGASVGAGGSTSESAGTSVGGTGRTEADAKLKARGDARTNGVENAEARRTMEREDARFETRIQAAAGLLKYAAQQQWDTRLVCIPPTDAMESHEDRDRTAVKMAGGTAALAAAKHDGRASGIWRTVAVSKPAELEFAYAELAGLRSVSGSMPLGGWIAQSQTMSRLRETSVVCITSMLDETLALAAARLLSAGIHVAIVYVDGSAVVPQPLRELRLGMERLGCSIIHVRSEDRQLEERGEEHDAS